MHFHRAFSVWVADFRMRILNLVVVFVALCSVARGDDALLFERDVQGILG